MQSLNMRSIEELLAELEKMEKLKKETVDVSHAWFYYKGKIDNLRWVLYEYGINK